MKELIQQAAELLRNSKHTTAFTGAGISVESGIPPFRGENGLWSKYDPIVLDINYFNANPRHSWEVIKEIFYDFFGTARPNDAHYFLARLEKEGLLSSVITQNIDNLHQEAGSHKVHEYHGSSKKLVCMKCGHSYLSSEVQLDQIPVSCSKDGGLMKPDFVFFGEAIPEEAQKASNEETLQSEVFLLIGTTGEIMPASLIPSMAKENGSTIIEINTTESNYTNGITDIFLRGKATDICSKLSKYLFT